MAPPIKMYIRAILSLSISAGVGPSSPWPLAATNEPKSGTNT